MYQQRLSVVFLQKHKTAISRCRRCRRGRRRRRRFRCRGRMKERERDEHRKKNQHGCYSQHLYFFTSFLTHSTFFLFPIYILNVRRSDSFFFVSFLWFFLSCLKSLSFTFSCTNRKLVTFHYAYFYCTERSSLSFFFSSCWLPLPCHFHLFSHILIRVSGVCVVFFPAGSKRARLFVSLPRFQCVIYAATI